MRKEYITILGALMVVLLSGCSAQSNNEVQVSPIKNQPKQYDTYDVEDENGETHEIRVEIKEPNFYDDSDPLDYYRGY